jgi:hypothetical protein
VIDVVFGDELSESKKLRKDNRCHSVGLHKLGINMSMMEMMLTTAKY